MAVENEPMRLLVIIIVGLLTLSGPLAADAQIPPTFVLSWGDSGSEDGFFSAPQGISSMCSIQDSKRWRTESVKSAGIWNGSPMGFK